ncbi:MAG: hypothetical protein ACRC7O_17655 [Fimbriiglobus sp.]
MAFRDFTLPKVVERFGLTVRDAKLFTDPPRLPVRPDLVAQIEYGENLSAAIDTEKATSEFVIAPILVEIHRARAGDGLRLFSGVDWSVDPDRGLNGVCDFLFTWGPSQHYLTPPVAVVAEAKRYDFHTGFGQCVAGMVAAQIANERVKAPAFPIAGIVTYGNEWKFLRLDGIDVILDVDKYPVDDLPQLMGVLDLITRRPVATAA